MIDERNAVPVVRLLQRLLGVRIDMVHLQEEQAYEYTPIWIPGEEALGFKCETNHEGAIALLIHSPIMLQELQYDGWFVDLQKLIQATGHDCEFCSRNGKDKVTVDLLVWL